ncbi:MAG: response regulator transcription factor [Actinomycetota bacterium]|nr:response regulator transcription factor [Actinomycetota bacterium]
MHRKTVLFVTNDLEPDPICRHVLAELDVQVSVVSLAGYRDSLSAVHPDLVIADLGRDMARELPRMESDLFESGQVALLVIVETDMLPELRLPVRTSSDFIIRHASNEEHAIRIRNLIWPGEESTSADLVHIDSLTVNLATYQVSIAGEPIDLTYLEYALFSFLVTHPGRTYSRDVLLQRVWGFDYYGGSRTVDVHVRRIRAKLGPEYAQRLETVRGVGYLWSA